MASECPAQISTGGVVVADSGSGSSSGETLAVSGWQNITAEEKSSLDASSWQKNDSLGDGDSWRSAGNGTGSSGNVASEFSSASTSERSFAGRTLGNIGTSEGEWASGNVGGSESKWTSGNVGGSESKWTSENVGGSESVRPVSYCETTGAVASLPCVVTHDPATLGYPWNREFCLESDACCVRGQGVPGQVISGQSVPGQITGASPCLTNAERPAEGVVGGVWVANDFSGGSAVSGSGGSGNAVSGTLVPGSGTVTDQSIFTDDATFAGQTSGNDGRYSAGLASESFSGESFSGDSLGRGVGNGRGAGSIVGLEALYSPEEERYHYWDSRFQSCLPGFGRELPTSNEPWTWQMTPGGTLYRAHFASNREGRLGIHFVNEDTTGLAYWDPTLGGRINLIRYGTRSRLYPEGIQWDVECGAIARLTLKGDRDLHGTDYRIAFPLTFRKGRWEFKFGYYHISSHMGDEWIVKHYEATGEVYRINYVRDCLMWGIAYRPDANWRFYVGGDYVFWRDCGAKPLQFEAGVEYSPMMLPNFRGSPFLAVHFRWSEDTDFDTYSALEAGWQWKTVYQQTLRTGLYAMAGYADQYQFYDRWEKQIGYGIWFDF